MTKLDEAKIIKIFQQSFGKGSKFVPEDVEILRIGKVHFVTKSDMLVESTDVPPGMKIDEIARKSMVACVSDFSAKGIKPLYATISLAIPRGFSKSKIMKLASGFKKSSKEFCIKILGGDTNEGKEIVIEVSMFGIAQKIVNRKGAKVGDVIVTSGPFGYTASGLKIILNHCRANPQFIKKSKKQVFVPKPRLRFGLAIARYLSSSMDSSDGLSTTLNEMSRQSSKKFVITKPPSPHDVEKFAKANRIRFLDLVFNGGEEYEIVATVSSKNLPRVKKIARIQKIPLFVIGHVTKGKNVIYQHQNKITTIEDRGWLHFKS
ncbi:MAG TPA: thiamine-phosphate kinase [Nitrosopumilaceae archaeon]|nr:thiamine-phosphate kinase [Nitrosopumilaceae archaeon]